jgi:hypothetical protein
MYGIIQRSRWFARILLILLAVAVAGIAMQLASGPRVLIAGRNVFAGDVVLGSLVTSHVLLINVSQHPVNVSLDPFCGCTTVMRDPLDIKPFSFVRIPIRITTVGLHVGKYSKGVGLLFASGNDEWAETVSLRLNVIKRN